MRTVPKYAVLIKRARKKFNASNVQFEPCMLEVFFGFISTNTFYYAVAKRAKTPFLAGP